MFTNQSTDVSLNSQCRAIDAVHADKVDCRWIAGTSQDVQIVKFYPDVNELTIEVRHDISSTSNEPICAVSCSHTNEQNLVTAQGSSATLWKLETAENEEDLEQITSFLPTEGFGAKLVDLAWREIDEGDLLTLDTNGHLTQWDVATESLVQSVDTVTSESSSSYTPPKVTWDPHSNNGDAVVVTTGTSVSILDWRMDTAVPTGTASKIKHCHRGAVSSLDMNPNKPYILATAGHDGLVKVWDLRRAVAPALTVRGGHSHWISNIQYNFFHDQLLLSGGTDSNACLWRLSTVSSAPLLDSPNVRVQSHEHTDSCYALSWAAADAWMYVTVSYSDGKVVLTHVPSKEKYKILL